MLLNFKYHTECEKFVGWSRLERIQVQYQKIFHDLKSVNVVFSTIYYRYLANTSVLVLIFRKSKSSVRLKHRIKLILSVFQVFIQIWTVFWGCWFWVVVFFWGGYLKCWGLIFFITLMSIVSVKNFNFKFNFFLKMVIFYPQYHAWKL